MGKQALDFLIQNSGSRVNLEVDFFGGEPLMNWQVVKDLVAYARSQEPSTTRTSASPSPPTGCCWTTRSPNSATGRCTTWSSAWTGGRKSTTACGRTTPAQGSYDLIVPKFQRFVQQRGDRDYYIRGTFTHENTDFTNDIFHMADLASPN